MGGLWAVIGLEAETAALDCMPVNQSSASPACLPTRSRPQHRPSCCHHHCPRIEREYVAHLAAHGMTLREQAAVPLLNHVLGEDRKVRWGR